MDGMEDSACRLRAAKGWVQAMALPKMHEKGGSMTETYDVVWPSGRQMHQGHRLAKRLDTLEGKTVAQLWDWVFKGDIMFDIWEREMTKLYPGIKFVSWREFGEIHGANEHEVLEALPQKLKDFNVDAVIVGVGC
ncbi:hypothetical protein DIE28_11035 [Paracoccus thiocyanatus]|uniref:UGSC-like domain-containing protein n=2 Tax=Paracoccus TaxID=265 RepID=A0A3D8PC84_9RHOB|nr:hypothetical protein DIE28_11035 [Paracoccus thiocyanatus]